MLFGCYYEIKYRYLTSLFIISFEACWIMLKHSLVEDLKMRIINYSLNWIFEMMFSLSLSLFLFFSLSLFIDIIGYFSWLWSVGNITLNVKYLYFPSFYPRKIGIRLWLTIPIKVDIDLETTHEVANSLSQSTFHLYPVCVCDKLWARIHRGLIFTSPLVKITAW